MNEEDMDVEKTVGGNIGNVEMDVAIQVGSCGTVGCLGRGEMVAPIAEEGDQVGVNGSEIVKERVHEDHDCPIFDETSAALHVALHVALHFEAAVPTKHALGGGWDWNSDCLKHH